MVLRHKFVRSIPKGLKKRTLYISTSYNTVVHECCCGCGEEVVTPVSPTDWRLTYDGKSISLYPSIGNWSFDCQLDKEEYREVGEKVVEEENREQKEAQPSYQGKAVFKLR